MKGISSPYLIASRAIERCALLVTLCSEKYFLCGGIDFPPHYLRRDFSPGETDRPGVSVYRPFGDSGAVLAYPRGSCFSSEGMV